MSTLGAVVALLAVAPGGQGDAVREDRELMHTVVTVVIADPVAAPALDAAFADAFSVFEDIDRTMNEWKPGSPLWEINRAAGGAAVAAPPAVCDVLRVSMDGARRTGGLFDPSWAALRDTWRFADGETGTVPAADAVKKQCALVRYQDIELKPRKQGCTVRLARPGMKLGLGGVVKGWGVDQAAARLRARGLQNFFIQAGGDLYFAGKRGERPWHAGIRDPRGPPEKIFARMDVEDRAFSTSGDYEHWFMADGTRYHHIIDPRTCWPGTRSRSVTVLAKTAVDAEFLSKAVFLLGGEEGLALAESWGAAAVIVDSENRVHQSAELRGRLETVADPSP